MLLKDLKLYCIYSLLKIIYQYYTKCNTCESVDEPKQDDEIVINTQQDVNKEAKPKRLKRHLPKK